MGDLGSATGEEREGVARSSSSAGKARRRCTTSELAAPWWKAGRSLRAAQVESGRVVSLQCARRAHGRVAVPPVRAGLAKGQARDYDDGWLENVTQR